MSYENDIFIRARAEGRRHKEKPRGGRVYKGLYILTRAGGGGVLPWTQALVTQGQAVGPRRLQFPEQSQPLATWIQQTPSWCHGDRNGKPRGSPDQRQRLRRARAGASASHPSGTDKTSPSRRQRLPGAGALRACPRAYKTPSLGTSRALTASV